MATAIAQRAGQVQRVARAPRVGDSIDNLVTVLAGPPIVDRGRNSNPVYDALYAAIIKVPQGTWVRMNELVDEKGYSRYISAMQKRSLADNIKVRSIREAQGDGNFILNFMLEQRP